MREEGLSNSEDTKNLLQAIRNKEKEIDIGHAGTSLRFLTSYLSTRKNEEYTLTGSKRIQERPIKELVKVLKKMGAEIEYIKKEGFAPLKIKGNLLAGGGYEIDGTISSQFITSLLLIAPILQNGIELQINGCLVSSSYIKMTLKLMAECGIESFWKNNIIKIKPQPYDIRKKTVESDWSAASFWFEIASLSSSCNIILNGLDRNSIQGDKECIVLFEDLGVNAEFSNNSLILTKNQNMRKKTSYDLINCPDLYQPLASTLYAKNIQTTFTGIQTLKYKETNRLNAVSNELNKLSSHKIIETYQDHRMAMSFAPLCLKFGEIQINNIETVNKSYPNFWNDLRDAGFIIYPTTD